MTQPIVCTDPKHAATADWPHRCVLPHHPWPDGCQRVEKADLPALVCGWHRAGLLTLLGEISRDWMDLALIVEAGSAPADTTPKTRHLKAPASAAPANLDVLSLWDVRSSEVMIVVSEWTRLVLEENVDLHALDQAEREKYFAEHPTTVDSPARLLGVHWRPPSSTVAQLDLLTKHLGAIVGSLWVDDFWREMSDLSRQLKSVLRDVPYRREGSCVVVIKTDVTDRCHCACHATAGTRPSECDIEGGCDVGHVELALCGGAVLRENGTELARCVRCRAEWKGPIALARLWQMMKEA